MQLLHLLLVLPRLHSKINEDNCNWLHACWLISREMPHRDEVPTVGAKQQKTNTAVGCRTAAVLI